MKPFAEYPQLQAELERAMAARADGNEGMARVCARRAAGIAAGEYLKRTGIPCASPSAYDRLKYLSEDINVPNDIRQTAANFLVRVTPDHRLPVEVDLIQEAQRLIEKMLGAA